MRKEWKHPADLGRDKRFFAYAVICSDHFQKSYYTPKNWLKKSAVPTILYPKQQSSIDCRMTRTSNRLDENVSLVCFVLERSCIYGGSYINGNVVLEII